MADIKSFEELYKYILFTNPWRELEYTSTSDSIFIPNYYVVQDTGAIAGSGNYCYTKPILVMKGGNVRMKFYGDRICYLAKTTGVNGTAPFTPILNGSPNANTEYTYVPTEDHEWLVFCCHKNTNFSYIKISHGATAEQVIKYIDKTTDVLDNPTGTGSGTYGKIYSADAVNAMIADIEGGGSTYILPAASFTELGGIKLSGATPPSEGNQTTTYGKVSLYQQQLYVEPASTSQAGAMLGTEKSKLAALPTNDQLTTTLNGKQATLVSGTNIKTVNGESLLGSGNITIEGGGESIYSVQEKPFDTSTLVPNTYIVETTGVETAYTGWSSTGYIDITDISEDFVELLGLKANNTFKYSAYYDANHNYISAATVGTTYVMPPSNTKYIRISGSNGQMAELIYTARYLSSAEDSGSSYTLPVATTSALGGIKVTQNAITQTQDLSNYATNFSTYQDAIVMQNATTTTNGAMSSTDKGKLDSLKETVIIEVLYSQNYLSQDDYDLMVSALSEGKDVKIKGWQNSNKTSFILYDYSGNNASLFYFGTVNGQRIYYFNITKGTRNISSRSYKDVPTVYNPMIRLLKQNNIDVIGSFNTNQSSNQDIVIPIPEYLDKIEYADDNLYLERDNGDITPVNHPDLSTQPSVLPQRFGKKNVYEVVIARMPEGVTDNAQYFDIIDDGTGTTDEYLNVDEGKVIPKGSVIMSASLFGNGVNSQCSAILKDNTWTFYPYLPINLYKDKFEWLLVRYYNWNNRYYSGGGNTPKTLFYKANGTHIWEKTINYSPLIGNIYWSNGEIGSSDKYTPATSSVEPVAICIETGTKDNKIYSLWAALSIPSHLENTVNNYPSGVTTSLNMAQYDFLKMYCCYSWCIGGEEDVVPNLRGTQLQSCIALDELGILKNYPAAYACAWYSTAGTVQGDWFLGSPSDSILIDSTLGNAIYILHQNYPTRCMDTASFTTLIQNKIWSIHSHTSLTAYAAVWQNMNTQFDTSKSDFLPVFPMLIMYHS